ncbi:immunoglobulin lambda-1 light chain-like [Narcine bancroftii]|uniref:immunoglobulin lambda-1 light chain-like n=1 Tax=Narcine bancroftii TaxID=1343680 RepID=UPI0038321F92
MRTLCFLWSLALWLGSGDSQTLYQPPSVSVNAGSSATLECNIGTKDSYYLSFYKQTPGTHLQWILYHYYSYGTPSYGPGFNSNRFTANGNSEGTVYRLIINQVEVNDAAVYYCGKWFSTSNTFVFGPGTKLFVTAENLPEPSLKLLGPSSEEISAQGAGTLVCLVSKLSLGFPAVSWTVDWSPARTGVETSPAMRNKDNTFSLSSYLKVPGTDWSRGKVYSCTVQQGAASATSATVAHSSC